MFSIKKAGGPGLGILFSLVLLMAGVCVPTASAQTTLGENSSQIVEVIEFSTGSGPYTGEASVPAGKSMIFQFNRPVREVLIGDPEKADVIPLTDRNIYLLGKQLGGTTITLFGDRKRLLGVIDLQVTYDIVNLKKRLYDMMPEEKIEVRTNGDSILLSGSVKNNSSSLRAAQLAENYAPDRVVNMIEIGASQQVMLAVRFAEVERTAAKALGISTGLNFSGGDGSVADVSTSFVNPTALDTASFAQIFGAFPIGDVSIDILLDALEERGVASILAEPTLIAVSGEPASFLAGGEFPVPVGTGQAGVGGGLQVEIEFKEFGVRLSFTPTVIGENISLLVEPEVSELDPQSGIEVSGLVIPGLNTRRASTTVELKNGQSFAIAGLLSKRFIDELDQLPGISSTPILGALMRSARYEREETELTIIITPYLVEPSDPGTLTTPFDTFSAPHELDLFFLGKTEANQPFDFIPRAEYYKDTPTYRAKDAIGYIVE